MLLFLKATRISPVVILHTWNRNYLSVLETVGTSDFIGERDEGLQPVDEGAHGPRTLVRLHAAVTTGAGESCPSRSCTSFLGK